LFHYLLFLKNTNAQHSPPDTIRADFISSKLNFDGKLSEAFWQTTNSINNFTQRELDFGKPATEQTKVADCCVCTSFFV
jgi:hypothetical protein